MKNRRSGYLKRGIYGICLFLAFLMVFSSGNGVFAETISGGENEEVTVDPTGEEQGFSAVLYDNTNGLPTAEANAIAETSEGFIPPSSRTFIMAFVSDASESLKLSVLSPAVSLAEENPAIFA